MRRSEHPRSSSDAQVHPSSATGRPIPFDHPTHMHIEQTARRRSTQRHPPLTSCTPARRAQALDVLSRRERGQSRRTTRGRSCLRSSSTRSVCASRLGRTRAKRRTFEAVHAGPRLARLLEVVEELRRPVRCTRARPHSAWLSGQLFNRTSRMRGFSRECRASAAREAWRFERVAVRTHQGAQ